MVKKLINGRWVVLEPVTFHLPNKDVIAYKRADNKVSEATKPVALRKLDMFGGE